MTNRLRLLKTNEYELLLRIQGYMNYFNSDMCILEAVMNMPIPMDECSGNCRECIQKWLNIEEGSSLI